MKVLVTGGLGFIGGHFVNYLYKKKHQIIVVDKLTYAADITKTYKNISNFFEDISSYEKMDEIIGYYHPDIIINFAAETHVDNSIVNSNDFIQSNIVGVHSLLEAVRKHKIKKFIQISTDEVYGDILKGSFKETDKLNPSSPYSASKAAADLLIKSYIRTYNFPAIIIRPCNNYGENQHEEKFIPKILKCIKEKKKVPVYGNGKNKREWLNVNDCVRGIYLILTKGKLKEIYNIGSGEEFSNLEILKMLNVKPKFVKDRKGHDKRYKLNFNKLKKLGWKPSKKFKKVIKKL